MMAFAARYRMYYAAGTLLLLTSIISYWLLVTYPASQRTKPVFVYATLMNPFVRAYACRCLVASELAVLSGYYRDGRTIIASSTAEVHGARITVSPTELSRLDRFEEVPNRYRRDTVLIADEPVFVYIKNDQGMDQLEENNVMLNNN